MTSKYSRLPFRVAVVLIATLFLAGVAAATTEQFLHNFPERAEGGARNTLLYASGNLYGTISTGGHITQDCSDGCGMVFELAPSGSGGWNYRTLYRFRGKGDGAFPVGRLIMDAGGNLYGATERGGAAGGSCHHFCGIVFKLTPSSTGEWTKSLIFAFSLDNGSMPESGVTMDASGNLFGTTLGGGANLLGEVYELKPNSDGTWTQEVIYSFTGLADGHSPRAEVTLDAAGNVYGTTSAGGLTQVGGAVFQLTPNSGGWTETTLYSFVDATGCGATAPLLLDSAGDLLGTATGCGPGKNGVDFELIRNSDNTWTEKTLHAFGGVGDGGTPESGLTPDGRGNYYGTTLGTVYMLKPTSSGSWTEAVIFSFPSGNSGDCGEVFAGITIGKAGTLYGVCSFGGPLGGGSVFQLSR